MSACHAEDRGFESRRFRFEYLFKFLVIVEHLFFHLDRLSLHTLSCLWLFAHALRQCLTDTSSVFVTLFVGFRRPVPSEQVRSEHEWSGSAQRRVNLNPIYGF